MKSLLKFLLVGPFFGLLSLTAHAEWELNNFASSLYYVTGKAAAISEVNTFTNLSGAITDDGTATLAIDLASVDTAIEIRDQRVKDILFEIEEYPTATITIEIDSSALANLATGSYSISNYDYSLSLHGMTAELNTDLRLSKISDSRIEIQPAQPIIIAAGIFGLAAGVEALREVAGLPSINPNVVVDFSLSFDQGM